jgi:magnesium transporter
MIGRMIVDLAVYTDGQRRPGEVDFDQAFEAGREPDSFVWIGLFEPTEDEFAAVREEFNLHELAVEDAIKAHQRPKMEVYDDSLFIVLKTARYNDAEESVEFAEIQLFIGEGFVVTVRHGEASALAQVRKSVQARPELLKLGPTAVLYAVIDRVVDDYGPVITGIDNDLREVEAEVFTHERTNPGERIFQLKREVLDFHRNTEPLIEALDRLEACSVMHTHTELSPYFRDAKDHLLRTVGRIDAYGALLSDALNANLAQVSVRQNDDMRTISAWVAIAAIPTMFGGIYGMNFEFMPELHSTWGYPIVLALMVVLCIVAYWRFKKAGWL